MNWKTCFTEASPFERTALWTLAITFFLIFVGGLVRVSGAGLGCPDWPRCFGLWVPPFTADAVPPPYDPAEFNVINTWMEYFNRLVGLLVGLFILLTFVRAIRFFRSDPTVFGGAAGALLLVLFQGWLGGQVVRSGLEGWMISVHMVVAVLILNVLLFTVYRSMRQRLQIVLPADARTRLSGWLVALILVTLLQIVLGTQIREALSEISASYVTLPRGEWIEQVGLADQVHRAASWLILGLSLAFYAAVRKRRIDGALRELAALNNSAVLLQIVLGAGLVYLALPPALQLFHLGIAAFMTSIQFLALLFVRHATTRA